MGVFSGLSKVFGGGKPAKDAPVQPAPPTPTRTPLPTSVAGTNGHAAPPAPTLRSFQTSPTAVQIESKPQRIDKPGDAMAGVKPIAHDIFDDSDMDDTPAARPEPSRQPTPAPTTIVEAKPELKNRGELINELRKNYSEVLDLVRKVDHHLDLQTTRSDKLLKIAEDSVRKLDILPEMRDQNKRVADSLNELVQAVKDGSARNDAVTERIAQTTIQHLESAQMQTSALQQVQASIARSGEAEAQMATSMAEFKDALGAMRANDAEREKELGKLVAGSQRWLIAAVAVCGLLAIGTLVLVIRSGG